MILLVCSHNCNCAGGCLTVPLLPEQEVKGHVTGEVNLARALQEQDCGSARALSGATPVKGTVTS